MLPKTAANLIISKLDDELLIYHAKNEKATCLSHIGRLVFQACAGELSEQQLQEELRKEGILEIEQVISETLAALSQDGLLDADQAPLTTFDRRRFLAAAGAAASLPVVLSTLAPRPAYALSCVNCAVTGQIPNTCTDCGKKCPQGAGCSATAVCCFEYVYDPANDGNPNACQNEFSSFFRCRAGILASFNPSCATSRAAKVGQAFGTLYYCCVCPGAPATDTC
jgi:hypothetical protein